jgi:hypothetical protein
LAILPFKDVQKSQSIHSKGQQQVLFEKFGGLSQPHRHYSVVLPTIGLLIACNFNGALVVIKNIVFFVLLIQEGIMHKLFSPASSTLMFKPCSSDQFPLTKATERTLAEKA